MYLKLALTITGTTLLVLFHPYVPLDILGGMLIGVGVGITTIFKDR